jgi:hypothetical protein
MVNLGLRLEELSNQLLEQFAREGTRLALSIAIEEKVASSWKRRFLSSILRDYLHGILKRALSPLRARQCP